MSQENVEIVRASWEAWGRGDMGALFDFYDPGVEWDMSHSYVPGMEVFHGHDGVREFFREWGEFFAEYHAEPEGFVDAGDSVVARVRQHGRGRASNVGVEMPCLLAGLPAARRPGGARRDLPGRGRRARGRRPAG